MLGRILWLGYYKEFESVIKRSSSIVTGKFIPIIILLNAIP